MVDVFRTRADAPHSRTRADMEDSFQKQIEQREGFGSCYRDMKLASSLSFDYSSSGMTYGVLLTFH